MKINFDEGMPPQRVRPQFLHALEKNRTETVLGWGRAVDPGA